MYIYYFKINDIKRQFKFHNVCKGGKEIFATVAIINNGNTYK